jgi:hypothetical protein
MTAVLFDEPRELAFHSCFEERDYRSVRLEARKLLKARPMLARVHGVDTSNLRASERRQTEITVF